MLADWRHRAQPHAAAVLSGALVLVLGALGLLAGHSAGSLAVATHVKDREVLQHGLGTLSGQWVNVIAGALAVAVTSQEADGHPSWSTSAGASDNEQRLIELGQRAPVFDAGFQLLSATGRPIATVGDSLPPDSDAGWEPLRHAVAANDGSLRLSGVMREGGRPVLALAQDVPLDDRTRGVVIGFWHAEPSSLQRLTAELTYGSTGHGWILDRTGTVVAGPDFHLIGRPLPDAKLAAAVQKAVATRSVGMLDEPSGSVAFATYSPAGATGWVSLTTQDHAEFLGPLQRAGRIAEVAVLALLLISSSGLVVLNRRRESALKRVAVRDELTGLLNRRGWFEQAGLELNRAGRAKEERVLLFVDVDGLKQVNDVLGHREGDRAIRDAANVLARSCRVTDAAGRLGGDEFVLLLGEGGDANVVGARVLEVLAEHNRTSGAGFELRLSLGAEVWTPEDGCGVDELVRRADAVMYVDKRSRPSRRDGVVRTPEPATAASS